MPVYRSALLRVADEGRALYDEDGLLAIGPDARGRQRVLAAGAWQALSHQYAHEPVTLIDRELFRFDVIWAAAGHPHGVFPLSPDDLVRLTGAPVHDVTQEPAA